MDTTIEKFEHAGLTVTLGWEEDGSFADPRDADNLGTMLCWHPDYVLGDMQFSNPDGRGAIGGEPGRDTRFHRDDFESIEALHRYLTLVELAMVVLPLTIYDHSGVTMFVGGKHDFPFDSAGWDTTHVGFIYTTMERVKELGAPENEEEIERILRGEVKVYASWLAGEVYWYSVEDDEGEYLDGCGGYVGDLDYVKKEAIDSAEWHAKDIAINQEPNFPEGLRA